MTRRSAWSITRDPQDRPVRVFSNSDVAGHRRRIHPDLAARLQLPALGDYVVSNSIPRQILRRVSVVLAYDGVDPHPPTYCYLKPYYLDPNVGCFERVARGDV